MTWLPHSIIFLNKNRKLIDRPEVIEAAKGAGGQPSAVARANEVGGH